MFVYHIATAILVLGTSSAVIDAADISSARSRRALRGIDTIHHDASFLEETDNFWGRNLQEAKSIGSNDDKPTPRPTCVPSESPTDPPTMTPTRSPTNPPTMTPTLSPTGKPSAAPIVTSCSIGVEVSCTTEAATGGDTGQCADILAIGTRCDERATRMTMKYNGGDCTQSFNIQEIDQFGCVDTGAGPPTTGSVWIVVAALKDPATVYFEGSVEVGGTFDMFDGGERFEADSTVTVYPDSDKTEVLQVSNFHTSCSQNLFLKDKFGSIQVVEFENGQGIFSCFVDATYSYAIANTGSVNDADIIEFTRTSNGEEIDLLAELGMSLSVAPGEILEVSTASQFDMTIRQEYSTFVEVTATTTPGGQCADSSDALEFVVGNPLPPVAF
mmetsp:Transcript_13324/g.28270  ORF Transcript_13324/g.28270 Transcript_13324/m.28270 type:complete len:386 (-) Transcript_13324:2053-3210(-)